jgi:hypothetical protein
MEQTQQTVVIVLTDEALIYERREVPGDYADEAIRQLNAEVSNFAGADAGDLAPRNHVPRAAEHGVRRVRYAPLLVRCIAAELPSRRGAAMTFVAIIEGISGTERFLSRAGPETPEKKNARRFRSEATAAAAAKAHVNAFPPVITRAMKFRVEPLA